MQTITHIYDTCLKFRIIERSTNNIIYDHCTETTIDFVISVDGRLMKLSEDGTYKYCHRQYRLDSGVFVNGYGYYYEKDIIKFMTEDDRFHHLGIESEIKYISGQFAIGKSAFVPLLNVITWINVIGIVKEPYSEEHTFDIDKG